jgi:hypothetical protein
MGASMTKRDFEVIAGTIRDLRRHHAQFDHAETAEVVLDSVARSLAGKFFYANPRFDRSRFMAACQGEDSSDMAGRAVRYSTMKEGGVAS